jgi:hydroxyacylglutathione hydrolase
MPDDVKVLTLTLGPLQANCFVVAQGADCLVIDPGDEGPKVDGLLERAGLAPRAILLTHGHFDHVGAADALASAHDVPVYIGAEDQAQAARPGMDGLVGLRVTPVSTEMVALTGEQTLDLVVPVTAIPTPGHSRGSYTFAVTAGEQTHLFSGDLLFSGSVGRTDLPGGDWETLLSSVTDLVRRFPPNSIVHCGHGPDTTLSRELAINPFLSALRRGASS